MASTPETKSTSDSDAQVVEQAKAEIRAAVEEALRSAQAPQKKEALAQELRAKLVAAEDQAKEVMQDLKDKKQNQHQEEGKKTLQTLTKVLEAAKLGVFESGTVIKPTAQELLKELAKKNLTVETAAAIETHLKDYLLGDKEIRFSTAQQEKTEFEEAFERLADVRPGAAEIVRDAVAEKAERFNQTKEGVKEKLHVEATESSTQTQGTNNPETKQSINPITHENEDVIQDDVSRKLEGAVAYTWDYDNKMYYSGRFNSTEIDQLVTFYDPKLFIKYIQDAKNAIENNKDIYDEIKRNIEERLRKKDVPVTEEAIKKHTEEEVMEKVSKKFETDLVNMLDKVHVRLSRDRASKAYEEIAQEDIYHGIVATMGGIRRAIENSASELEDYMQKHPELKHLKLFKHSEKKPIIEDIELASKQGQAKTLLRINQLVTPEEVSAADYVRYLELVMNEFIHSRSYLHNARSIYNHPAGEKGFYGGLGSYAEQMQGGDLDSMLNLPDGNLALEAFQMYDKFLDEQFALQDWKHEPSQFTTKQGGFQSHLEEEVIAALERMHPDMTRERLTSALYMGVGMARGVFLNEPEKAAYADPVLTPDGGFTGASYYTNDVSALMPFNPTHMYYRWMGEPNLYPFMFFPTDDVNGLGGGTYDHMKAWKLMQQYKDSYFKGIGTGKNSLEGKKLFINDVVDMGGTGGVMKRGGWRKLFTNEANYIYRYKEIDNNGKNVMTDIIDATKTWKTLEKVGFEIMQDFVTRIPEEVLRGSTKEGKLDRQELFAHIFNTYFQGEQDLNAYLHQIREGSGGGKERALNNIRDGKMAPNSLTEAIEEETSKIFIHRALARMVAQRIPTKFLRMDRDRFDTEGKSKWKRIRESLAQENSKWTSAEFDRLMKNLGMAEDMLRSDVSQQIRERLRETGESDLKFITDDLAKIDYRLTSDKIRSFFEKQNKLAQGKPELQFTEEDIKNTIRLFEIIQNEYSGKAEFLNGFAKDIEDKKYRFSFALDELDLSLMAFRGAGARIIPRSIKDIAVIEQALTTECLLKLHPVLAEIAANGKKDISPVIQMFQRIKLAYGDVHGYELGYEVTHKIAAAVITYFKKDTMSKGLLGLLRFGQKSSIAAEVAGRSGAVWEWEAIDIDNFINTLESHRLLPRDQYDHSKPPAYEPIWVRPPFSREPMKLPFEIKLPFKVFGHEKIPLFQRRVKDYKKWYADKLRKEYGGKWYNIVSDYTVKYGPLFIAFILYKFIKDALDEAQGKKKK